MFRYSIIAILTLCFCARLQLISSQSVETCSASAPYDEPTIDKDSNASYILISTTDCPPYDNPNWNNPGNALKQTFSFKIPKNPKYASSTIPVGQREKQYSEVWYLKNDPAPILGSIGVLVNGVVLFGMGSPCGVGKDSAPCPSSDPNAPSNYIDAYESEGWTFDQCGGHPSNMGGQYHIHSAASFINSTGRMMCDLPTDTPGDHSVILGWMYDGFAIYGQYSQGGLLPTELDSCHGHTHEIGGVMTYHYHMPTGFPYVIGCYKGCPETSNNANELNKFNDNTVYGCPNGQDQDPDPLYETYSSGSTPTKTITPSSVTRSTSTSSPASTNGDVPTTTATITTMPSQTNEQGGSGHSLVCSIISVLLCGFIAMLGGKVLAL